MSTLADSMLSWKANLTTRATPEQVLKLRADVNAFADGVRFLESENAKLRELVEDMWSHDYARHWSTLDSDMEHRESVWQRMHELGIEVQA